MKKVAIIIFWITILAIAMAFLESAIVVYLRKLYYPDGFSFPLKIIDADVAITEFLRELATLVMLLAMGILAGRTPTEKFAYFIYSFAVWDIFYYIFLLALLAWPESLLTWDVLFLVPVTWVGPVVGPIFNSVCMIVLALLIIHFTSVNQNATISSLEWTLLILGSLVVIVSYTEEYTRFMLKDFSFFQLISGQNTMAIIEKACTFIPQRFNWWIWCIGVVMHLLAIIHFANRQRKVGFKSSFSDLPIE